MGSPSFVTRRAFAQVAEPLPAHLPLSSAAPHELRESLGLRWVFGRCRQLIAPLITGLSIMPFSTYQLVAICL